MSQLNKLIRFLATLALTVSPTAFATLGGPYVIEVLGVDPHHPKVMFVDGWRDESGEDSTLRAYDPKKNAVTEKESVSFDVPDPEKVVDRLSRGLKPLKTATLKSAGWAAKITLLQSGRLNDQDRKPYRLLRVALTHADKASSATITLADYHLEGDPTFTVYTLPKDHLTIIKMTYIGASYEYGYRVDRLLFFKAGKFALDYHGDASPLLPDNFPQDPLQQSTDPPSPEK